MLDICIKTVPKSVIRNDGLGDYFYVGKRLFINVANMDNKDAEFLVFLHEAIEEHLTRRKGIREEDIDKFDAEFEANRKEGDNSEPGDHPQAPYRAAHRTAENIERLLAAEMGIDFNDYNNFLENCYNNK